MAQAILVMDKKDLSKLTEDEQVGYKIVRRALEEPIRQIAENAGLDGSLIADKVKHEKTGVGFDADRITSYNVCYTKLLRLYYSVLSHRLNTTVVQSALYTQARSASRSPIHSAFGGGGFSGGGFGGGGGGAW